MGIGLRIQERDAEERTARNGTDALESRSAATSIIDHDLRRGQARDLAFPNPRTLAGLGQFLGISPDDLVSFVHPHRPNRSPKNSLGLLLEIESTLHFAARSCPTRLPTLYQTLAQRGEFYEDPSLRKKWAVRVSHVQSIVEGSLGLVEPAAAVILGVRPDSKEMLYARRALGAISFGSTYLYNRDVVLERKRQCDLALTPNPLLREGFEAYFGFEPGTALALLRNRSIVEKKSGSGEKVLDAQSVYWFGFQFFSEASTREEFSAKIEHLRQSIHDRLNGTPFLQGILANVCSEINPGQPCIDQLERGVAQILSHKGRFSRQDLEQELLRAKTFREAVEEQLKSEDLDAVDQRVNQLCHTLAADKESLLSAAFHSHRKADIDLRWLHEPIRLIAEAPKVRAPGSSSQENSPSPNGKGSQERELSAFNALHHEQHGSHVVPLPLLEREKKRATSAENPIGFRLDELTKDKITSELLQELMLTGKPTLHEVAVRLVKKRLVSPKLHEEIESGNQAAAFLFDESVVGKHAAANLRNYISQRYKTLDDLHENDFLLKAVTSSGRSGDDLAKRLVELGLMSPDLPVGHSIMPGRGKWCRYLKPEIVGGQEQVERNVGRYIKERFLTLDDFNSYSRRIEIFMLGKLLGLGNSPRALAKYAVQHGLVSGDLPEGHCLVAKSSSQYYGDEEIVGAAAKEQNIKKWIEWEVDRKGALVLPERTDSSLHQILGVVGLKRKDAIISLTARGLMKH